MKVFIVSIILLLPMFICAQNPQIEDIDTVVKLSTPGNQRYGWRPEYGYRHLATKPVLPDSADVLRHQKKHFWRAGAETVGFNIGLWAFDRYVLDGHYAYISWNSIKENFKHGFEWDDDHLHTNMFDHPYNGSIFFNAGRSNGFNFWQSELFAIGGSAMWKCLWNVSTHRQTI